MPSWSSPLRKALPYVVAVGAYWGFIGVSHGARVWWGITFDTTTLIILTMIASAWYGGLGPGLLVAVMFEITLDYFAWPPKDAVRFGVVTANRVVLFGSVVLFASARRAAERRLEAALGGERAARAEAETASRMKDEFLSVVSHELRTPLNAILGWAAALVRHPLDPPTQRRAAEAIDRNARLQAKLVDDLLSASGLLMGRLQIVPERVALGPLVRSVADQFSNAADTSNVQIHTTIEDAPAVFGDEARLRQVFEQLLSNAVKFTPAGGLITVQLSSDGDTVALTVRDNGVGIDARFLPFVFDRFRQADASFTRQVGGLGLGLAIARDLVELHGGTVSAHSEGLGLGAEFTVRLSAVQAPVTEFTTPDVQAL